jgi:hypothetical protein
MQQGMNGLGRIGACVALLALATLIASCTGIPLRSLPRLMKLQDQLLDANPAEFMLAIQADARVTPPAGAVPVLQMAIKPAVAGAFDPVDKKLPMRFAITSSNSLGLATPPPNRRWLVYSLPPESQAELQRLQAYFKRIQAQGGSNRGGSVSLGISQEGLAVRDPALANTKWETWLQTTTRDGFFELWSGTIADLLKAAKT